MALVFIVEDDNDIRQIEAYALKCGGFEIEEFEDAKALYERLEKKTPDLFLLDVMLPDGDGFSLFQKVREFSDFPILFLTARGEDEDKFTGLGLGADDYMVKPFLPRELILRVHVILKRSYRNESNLVYLKACALDFDRAEIIRNGEHIALTAKEFELLQVLSRNAGRIVTIDMLCEAVWGDNPFGYENSLMAHIRRIREKIEENPSRPESLLTVKGLGYKLLMEDVR